MILNTHTLFRGVAIMAAILMLPSMVAAKPLHIGSISDDPGDEVRAFQPLADYLAAELQRNGVDYADVVVAASMEEMVTLLRDGSVDLGNRYQL